MRFKRYGRYEFTDTPRKRAAFARKQRLEREALPLFADQIAAEQIGVDEEMKGRRDQWDRQTAADRSHRATQWRKARGRVRTYAPPVRSALYTYWQQCRWPADPEYLLTMLHMYDTGRLSLPGICPTN